MPSNDFPVAPSDPTDIQALIERERQNAHVFWLLRHAVTHPSDTGFDERQQERIRTHLAACDTCHRKASEFYPALLAELDIFDGAEPLSDRPTPEPWRYESALDDALPPTLLAPRRWTSPGLAALQMGEEHSRIGLVPDEDALDDYLADLIDQGEDAARQLYPEVATHTAACATCRNSVNALREAHAIVRDIAHRPGPASSMQMKTPQPTVQPATWWEHLADECWQLRQPFQIDVGRQTVAVLHELEQILGDFAQAPNLRRFALAPRPNGGGESMTAQSFMLDLRAERHTDTPLDPALQAQRWAHVYVKLRAESSRRLSGQIAYAWRRADGADEPAPNIRWSVTRDLRRDQDDGEVAACVGMTEAPTPGGATDERGYGGFVIDAPGRYLLTTEFGFQRWIIPFVVAYAPEKDIALTPQAPANQDAEQAEQFTMILFIDHDQFGQDAQREPLYPTSMLSYASLSIDGARHSSAAPHLRLASAGRSAPFAQGQRLTNSSSLDMTVERVARGGFSVVAMGPDRARGGQWVAVKAFDIASASLVDDERKRWLRAELTRDSLRSIGLWPHPNLLTVNDVVEIDAKPMLILDYAERGNLRDLFTRARMKNTWLTIATALRLAQQIAAGVAVLHQPDPELMRPDPITHGDLKPENILIDHQQYARVADMDLVRTLVRVGAVQGIAEDHSTVAGGAPGSLAGNAPHPVAGTPAYMPPEQWRDSASIVPATDAYAFGILLCELLAGRHPLLESSQRYSVDAWRQAHVTGRPIPIATLGIATFKIQRASVTGLDGALRRIERLILNLLAKQPEKRPTMRQALHELQASASEVGEEPYTPPDNYQRTHEYERNFWLHWANTYTRFGYYDEALPRIQRSLALAPGDPAILSAYGGIMLGLGRREEAIEAYQRALVALLPANVQMRAVSIGALSQLADAQVAAGRYTEAARTLREAAEQDPSSSGLWGRCAIMEELLARIAAQAGRPAGARQCAERGLACIERALSLAPGDQSYRDIRQWLRQLRDAC